MRSSVLFGPFLRLGATASGLGCASQEIGDLFAWQRPQQACEREVRCCAHLELLIPHGLIETLRCFESDLVQDHGVRHLTNKVDTRLAYSPAACRGECVLRNLQELKRQLTPLQRSCNQLQSHFSNLPTTTRLVTAQQRDGRTQRLAQQTHTQEQGPRAGAGQDTTCANSLSESSCTASMTGKPAVMRGPIEVVCPRSEEWQKT